jgi:hypothetical protein
MKSIIAEYAQNKREYQLLMTLWTSAPSDMQWIEMKFRESCELTLAEYRSLPD